MRASVALAALCLAATSMGQTAAFFAGVRAVIKQRPANPLEAPTGTQSVREGALPDPVPLNDDFEVIRSGPVNFQKSKFTGSGGVEFIYRGYRTFADRVEGDFDTDVFTLSGNVKIIGLNRETVEGDEVTVDYANRTFRAERSSAILPPAIVGGNVQTPIYTSGGVTRGSERRIFGDDSTFTTCEYPRPHYGIEARRTDLRVGRRIIFRDARIRLFGRTILSLPFLSIPLENRRYHYLPQVGQSRDEGYFIKNRYGIPLRDGSVFDSRLDYMTKLGTGIGGDYAYEKPNYRGLVNLYTVTGIAASLLLRNSHQQRFGWGSVALDNDIQRNNYFTAPNSTVTNTRAQVVLQQGRRNSTTLGFARSSSSYIGSESLNQTITVTDSRLVGAYTTNVDLALLENSNQYPGSPEYSARELDVRFRGNRDFRKLTAALEYTRNIPVGEATNFYATGDRTPVLTLSSDANRILGRTAGARLPFRTNFSLGEFGGLQNERVTRTYFDLDFNRPDRSGRRLRVDTQGAFRQGMYSDDTAQYVVSGSTNLSYRLGSDTSANLRYQYLRPEGYSPLNLDRTGRWHQATTDITARPLRYVFLGAQTGFDFNRANTQDVGWQQVGLRADFTPKSWLGLRTLATYDTISGLWSGVRLDLTYLPGATFVSLGARYDGYQGRWSNVNLYINNLKAGRTRLSGLATYNGFSKQVDAYQINAIYDLHCAEAVLQFSEYRTGFRPGREIQFFLRLKAFPVDSLFGIGRRGQPIGTGSNLGRDF